MPGGRLGGVLAALLIVAAGASDAAPYREMLGPYKDIREFCRKLRGEGERQCEGRDEKLRREKPPPPFTKASLYYTADRGQREYLNLVVTTKKGIFVIDDFAPAFEPGDCCHAETKVRRIGPRRAGERTVLAVEYERTESEEFHGAPDQRMTRPSAVQRLLLCGVGPSGVPSCSADGESIDFP